MFHTSATLARVTAAFGIAMGLGMILGVLLGLFPNLNRWFDPWIIFFLNLPALVVIVLCYLWIEKAECMKMTKPEIFKLPSLANYLR